MRPGPVELAMFPLGSVLLPGGRMPLRVFEPRYLALLDSLDPVAPRFGVTLIERGPEVGGGDVRASIGCRAELTDRVEGPDETVLISVVGRERIEVTEWLSDDPYPRAVVRELPEPAARPDDPVHLSLVTAYRRLMELAGVAGIDGAGGAVASDDPLARGYAIATTLPLGPLDAFGVLAAAAPEERARLLIDAIEGFELVIRARSAE